MAICLAVLKAKLIVLLCVQAAASASPEFASQLNSSDITHSSAVLSWRLPTDVTLVSEYRLTIIEGNDLQRELVIQDPAQTSYELKGLELWTNYTVGLVTYNLTHHSIGSSWHSFSTTFFFVNVKTLLAVGLTIFIVICYILALAINFMCNLDKDETEWRKIMIAEYDKKRRARKARAERRRRKHSTRSIKRQVSSLLGFRKSEDSTEYEDSITSNSIKSSSTENITNVLEEGEVRGQGNEHVGITNEAGIEIDLTNDVTRQPNGKNSDRTPEQDDAINDAIQVLDTAIENIDEFNIVGDSGDYRIRGRDEPNEAEQLEETSVENVDELTMIVDGMSEERDANRENGESE